MEWEGEGVVLSARRHGETSLILDVLTRAEGRASGLLKGGARGRKGGAVQPGDQTALRWRARLAEHLGNFQCETLKSRAARLFGDKRALLGLASALAMARLLPEREAHPRAYDGLVLVLDALGAEEDWPAAYVRWELGLLDELGYGLDLDACAATGERHDLVYVSPKSGRAVGRKAGAPYHDKLLKLPGFLKGQGPTDMAAVRDGLHLVGFFFERRLFEPQGRAMPLARARFLESLRAPAAADGPGGLAESSGEAIGSDGTTL